MQQRLAIEHDADMAFPEHKVAALQGARHLPVVNRRAAPGKLHVAVARQDHAAGQEGGPRQAGTIKTKALAATPKVGCMKETLGNTGRVVLIDVDGRDMLHRHPAGPVDPDELAFLSGDRQAAAHGNEETRRRFQVGLRIDIGAHYRHLVRGFQDGRRDRLAEHPADIAVAVQLDERKVSLFMEDPQCFTMQGLRRHLRVGARFGPYGRDAGAHLHGRTAFPRWGRQS